MFQENAMQQEPPGFMQQEHAGGERVGYKSDVIVLQSMLGQLAALLRTDPHTLTQPTIQPSFSFSGTRRPRLQRIVLYHPEDLPGAWTIPFVAFVSKRRRLLDIETVKAIHDLDRELVRELSDVDGLLAYISLELRTGQWYNLVLMRDETIKQHITGFSSHSYAAHELAPSYYAWIRLHYGWIGGGIDDGELVVQRTNYYIFPPSNHAGDEAGGEKGFR